MIPSHNPNFRAGHWPWPLEKPCRKDFIRVSLAEHTNAIWIASSTPKYMVPAVETRLQRGWHVHVRRQDAASHYVLRMFGRGVACNRRQAYKEVN